MTRDCQPVGDNYPGETVFSLPRSVSSTRRPENRLLKGAFSACKLEPMRSHHPLADNPKEKAPACDGCEGYRSLIGPKSKGVCVAFRDGPPQKETRAVNITVVCAELIAFSEKDATRDHSCIIIARGDFVSRFNALRDAFEGDIPSQRSYA